MATGWQRRVNMFGASGKGRAFLALSISPLGLHVLLGGCARVVDACLRQDLRLTKEKISF